MLVSSGLAILSDPWLDGMAFNNGWRLIYQPSPENVMDIVNEVTHICASHMNTQIIFSIRFCGARKRLVQRDVKIVFQNTRDRRLEAYLKKLGLEVICLDAGKPEKLSESCKVTLF